MDNDNTGIDKLYHFVVCYSIAALIRYILRYFVHEYIAVSVAFVVSFAVGIIKELNDSKKKGNHFCKWDLLVDCIGALLGALRG